MGEPRKPACFLGRISYALGEEARPITDLAELQTDPDLAEMLTRFGLQTFHQSVGSTLTLLRRSVAETLHCLPRPVDTVLFASRATERADFGPGELAVFLQDLGLERARVVGIGLAHCANLLASLQIAQLLVATGQARCVLLLAAERAMPAESRIVPPAISILSDAAASALLVADFELDYELLEVDCSQDAAVLASSKQTRFIEYMTTVGTQLRLVAARVLARAEFSASNLAAVIPSNYNTWMLTRAARMLGIEEARLFLDNVPRCAHAGAADVLINLSDRQRSRGIAPDARLLLLASGPMTWGAACIRATACNQ
jgi:3-oxoacyl-[acyl-carrier-protein] synthase-3